MLCAGSEASFANVRDGEGTDNRACRARSFRWAVLSVVIMLLAPFWAGIAEVKAAEKEGVRIVGPESVETIVKALAEKYTASRDGKRRRLSVRYRDKKSQSSAAHSFVEGDDLMLSWGKVDGGLSRRTKYRWDELAPEEHVLGARALGFVVHASNGLHSLTMDQLTSIFSGEISEWRVFGPGREGIQCYGPPYQNLVMDLYRETWNSRQKGLLVRKRNSRAVIDVVGGDRKGLGVVSATDAMSAGDSVKKLRVNGVALNAQTIRDGKYPVAQTLVLYVSPDASERAKSFAEFMVSGERNAILRKHGLMPALQDMRANVMGAFERLYGPEVERVKSTPGGSDDLELAEELVRSARAMNLNERTRAVMAQTAYDLASDLSGGETIAFAALGFLEKVDKDRGYECAKRRSDLYHRAYKARQSSGTIQNYVHALKRAADVATGSGRHVVAVSMWRRAGEVAKRHDLLERVAIERRMPGFEARAESQKQAQRLASRLEGNPEDEKTRRQLLKLYLMALDSPEKAEELMRPTDEEEIRTNLPLALESNENLSKESALTLGEWYARMAGEADAGGEELLKARAKRYYKLFFRHHESRDDGLAQRATLGMKKVGGRVPPPGQAPKRRRGGATFEVGERITDMKLAEYVARNPNIRHVDHRKIDNAKRITDLRPLTYLRRLKHLELRHARKVTDLTPLSSLPGLRSLTMTGLRVEDVSELSGARRLEKLDISGAKNLSDLRPLNRLKELSVLTARNCPELADLDPLGEMEGLRKLNLSGCNKISDLTFLEDLGDSVTHLELRDCDGINDVYPLSKCGKLQHLDLRNCDEVAEADVDWLRRQLPECRIRAD